VEKGKGASAIGLKALTVAIAILALYHQDLDMVFNDALQNEATSHILAIPFIVAYLIYRKRKILGAVIPFETRGRQGRAGHLETLNGILLFATAALLYWHGSYTFNPLEYHILTLPLCAAGLTLILFNPKTLRELAFPIAFLTFLTPLPSQILYGLGMTLSVISSEASNALINALGVTSKISGEYGNPTIFITRPDGMSIGFTIDIACSGIYSLTGFLIFAAFVSYITRGKIWKRLTIFLLGLPLIYLINITRITTILLIGYHYGEQLALQIFHLMGGMVMIFAGTLLLLAVAKLFGIVVFEAQSPNPCPKCDAAPGQGFDFCAYCGRLLNYPKYELGKSEVIKIAAVATVTAFLLSIQVPVFALTEGPAEMAIQTLTGEHGNLKILPQIDGYSLQFVYRDRRFEEIAKQNASLLYAYAPIDGANGPVMVAVEVASTRSSLHDWEVCYITWPMTHGYQPSVRQLDLRDLQIQANPPIAARLFAFQYKKNNQTQVVLYWYETSIFKYKETAEKKHVKISLVTYPRTPEDIPIEEERLLYVAGMIASYWQPIKTWTQVAIVISQNGLILAAVIVVALAAVVAYQKLQDLEYEKATLRLYNKLSEEKKLIIRAVDLASKGNGGTLNEIASYFRGITGKDIENEQLLKRIREAEKAELIRGEITNHGDEPKFTYRTNLPKRRKLD
jgi:exosortase